MWVVSMAGKKAALMVVIMAERMVALKAEKRAVMKVELLGEMWVGLKVL